MPTLPLINVLMFSFTLNCYVITHFIHTLSDNNNIFFKANLPVFSLCVISLFSHPLCVHLRVCLQYLVIYSEGAWTLQIRFQETAAHLILPQHWASGFGYKHTLTCGRERWSFRILWSWISTAWLFILPKAIAYSCTQIICSGMKPITWEHINPCKARFLHFLKKVEYSWVIFSMLLYGSNYNAFNWHF